MPRTRVDILRKNNIFSRIAGNSIWRRLSKFLYSSPNIIGVSCRRIQCPIFYVYFREKEQRVSEQIRRSALEKRAPCWSLFSLNFSVQGRRASTPSIAVVHHIYTLATETGANSMESSTILIMNENWYFSIESKRARKQERAKIKQQITVRACTCRKANNDKRAWSGCTVTVALSAASSTG
jgi:hypothetical protein